MVVARPKKLFRDTGTGGVILAPPLKLFFEALFQPSDKMKLFFWLKL